jgi:hypothetical protein
MRYQQYASHAYCGATGPIFKMASQQVKVFCVLRFEMSRSVITLQREFRARFRNDAWCVFSKPCTKLTLHWYSFLLETDSTPGPYCGRKDYVNEKFQLHHREIKPRPSRLKCSASTNGATAYPLLARFFLPWRHSPSGPRPPRYRGFMITLS